MNEPNSSNTSFGSPSPRRPTAPGSYTPVFAAIERLIEADLRPGQTRPRFTIITDTSTDIYVQWIVGPDESLRLESLRAPSWLGRANDPSKRTARASRHLRLGWRPGSVSTPTNWNKTLPVSLPWRPQLAAQLLMRTLCDIHAADPAKLVVSGSSTPSPHPLLSPLDDHDRQLHRTASV